MKIKELNNITKVKCTNSIVPYFTKNKYYNISDIGVFIKDNEGDEYFIKHFDTVEFTFKPIYEPTTTPPHYQGTIQPIDLINAQNLNFNLGNVVKYVCRAGKKDGETTIKDLNKAIDYLNFEIERLSHE